MRAQHIIGAFIAPKCKQPPRPPPPANGADTGWPRTVFYEPTHIFNRNAHTVASSVKSPPITTPHTRTHARACERERKAEWLTSTVGRSVGAQRERAQNLEHVHFITRMINFVSITRVRACAKKNGRLTQNAVRVTRC